MKSRFSILKRVEIIIVLPVLLVSGCKQAVKSEVIIFYASTFSSLMESVKRDYKKSLLKTEISGSQVAIRKVTELGREADLVISADSSLFKKIGKNTFKYRIDFAHDELVLGVGKRARYIDQAELNWVKVLKRESVILGRVDENLGPIGYRTLLCWKLKEREDAPHLYNTLLAKSDKVVDHVSILASLLKAADLDYAFIYKSTALKNDIRFIELQKEINLGSGRVDYSTVSISFLASGRESGKKVIVKGTPITYSLAIAKNTKNLKETLHFIRYLLISRRALIEEQGFKTIKPQFYGSRLDYQKFKDIALYKGEF